MDINQYLGMFIEESNEHLQSLNENLLNLENNPKDKSILNEIFRVAHTIKGMAGTMGFTQVSKLTHEIENLLDEIRRGKVEVSTEIVDVLFKALDTLEEYISNISKKGEEGAIDNTELIESISMLMRKENIHAKNNPKLEDKHIYGAGLNQYITNVLSKATENGFEGFSIQITLEEGCMLKAARAFIVFNTLEKYSEIIESYPSVEDIEDEKFDLSFRVIVISKLDKTIIKKEIMNISEVRDAVINEIIIGPEDNSDTTNQLKDENNTEIEANHEINTENENYKRKKQSNKLGKTVRVDIDRLDNLMNLVSELIIIKTRMEDIGGTSEKQDMNEAIEYLERITTNLHDAVMKVRMVPIERVFNRFPRMVRDVSKELGKDIQLKMTGEETEVDRTIIDEIGDPLIHLIRNSIDHGIEKPEVRRKLGKSEAGTVKLRAYPDGNNVLIEVEDDGNGINLDKVKNSAIEKGILTIEHAQSLQEDDIIQLLFKPGFSTADKISDISGRGVGLDVVKNKIEAIGGNVEVISLKDKGTKFTIRLPLTLAIIQALLVRLGEEIYAIPLNSIKEITPIESKSIRKVQNQEVILFRNKTLPIIRLSKILGIETEGDSEEIMAVIVKKGEKEAGLIVDNLIGQQEIVIKSLGKYLSGINYLSGATILGNGNISLILDINSLF